MSRIQNSRLVKTMASLLGVTVVACSVVNAVDEVVTPPSAAVVMAGTVGAGAGGVSKLWVVDASSGALRGAPESMVVSGIIHDPFTDVWFIFEHVTASSPGDWAPASSKALVKLHVRRLDASSGIWGPDLAAPLAVPPNLNGTAAVLRGRLVYFAFPPSTTAPSFVANALAVIDTSEPTNVRLAAEAPDGLMMLPTADVVAQSVLTTPAPEGRSGGQANLVWASDCSSGMCTFNHASIALPDGGRIVPAAIGKVPAGTSVGAGSAWSNSANLLVYPVDGKKTLQQVSASDYQVPSGASAPFDMGNNVRPVAVDECSGIAFIVDGKTPAIAAVSMRSDRTAPAVAALPGAAGIAAAYEPVTKRLLVLEKAVAGNDVVLYGATASPDQVVLTPKRWPAYSNQLKPNLIAVATTASACP